MMTPKKYVNGQRHTLKLTLTQTYKQIETHTHIDSKTQAHLSTQSHTTTVDQLRSLIIKDRKSLMKVGPLKKKIKVQKVQGQEISKLRNFYVGKSLSPKSCL